MLYKGRMSWVPGDVMTQLYVDRNPRMTVADALRDVLGLEIPVAVVVAEKAEMSFDVTFMSVGDSITFDAPQRKVAPSIKNQVNRTGRQFELLVTDRGTQVIRTK